MSLMWTFDLKIKLFITYEQTCDEFNRNIYYLRVQMFPHRKGPDPIELLTSRNTNYEGNDKATTLCFHTL